MPSAIQILQEELTTLTTKAADYEQLITQAHARIAANTEWLAITHREIEDIQRALITLGAGVPH